MQFDTGIGEYYPVHDHGFVGLVDYMGSDLAVEAAARISYGAGTRKISETRHLIRYLYRHKHLSPFEMCVMKFDIACPIFVARQWVRHRTASWNEYSGRYSVMPPTFFIPDEVKTQSTTNSQGRSTQDASAFAAGMMITEAQEDFATYQELINLGVAREQARNVLPLSAYTRFFWKMDLRNLFHFLSLRLNPHAQKEIRDYALVIAKFVNSFFPISFAAWEDYDFYAVNFSRMERKQIAFLDTESDELSQREQKEFFEKRHPREEIDFCLNPEQSISPQKAQNRLHELPNAVR